MKAIHKADTAAYTLLLAGAVGSAITGLTKHSVARRIAGNSSSRMKMYYGLVGAASLYKFLRAVGPKTREERIMIKATKLYDRAKGYEKMAKKYRRAADVFFNRRVKNLKTATPF